MPSYKINTGKSLSEVIISLCIMQVEAISDLTTHWTHIYFIYTTFIQPGKPH